MLGYFAELGDNLIDPYLRGLADGLCTRYWIQYPQYAHDHIDHFKRLHWDVRQRRLRDWLKADPHKNLVPSEFRGMYYLKFPLQGFWKAFDRLSRLEVQAYLMGYCHGINPEEDRDYKMEVEILTILCKDRAYDVACRLERLG